MSPAIAINTSNLGNLLLASSFQLDGDFPETALSCVLAVQLRIGIGDELDNAFADPLREPDRCIRWHPFGGTPIPHPLRSASWNDERLSYRSHST